MYIDPQIRLIKQLDFVQSKFRDVGETRDSVDNHMLGTAVEIKRDVNSRKKYLINPHELLDLPYEAKTTDD